MDNVKETTENRFRVYKLSAWDVYRNLEGHEKCQSFRKWNFSGMFDKKFFETLSDYFNGFEDLINCVEKNTNYTLFNIIQINTNSNSGFIVLIFKSK